MQVDSLIAGLAAAQLLCLDVACCQKFVEADGMKAVMEVLSDETFNNSAISLLAVRAVECCSRHAVACDALISWHKDHGFWSSESNPLAIQTPLLKLLQQPLRPPVMQLTISVLKRLRAFETVSALQVLSNHATCDVVHLSSRSLGV